MQQIIFRVLALLIGIGAILVVIFQDEAHPMTLLRMAVNIIVAGIFILYAVGGKKLLLGIPILKEFVKTKEKSNK